MCRKLLFNIIFLIWVFSSISFAQLDVKRDDYVGSTNRSWWHWYDDGPSTPIPAVSDGFVLFSLVDPDSNYEPYCDAAFWDGYPAYGGPYTYCKITLRAKALNPPKLGSRGWGLWYTEPYPDVQNQAWFMGVHDSTGAGYTGLDWWRAETTNGRTEATHNYTDLDVAPHMVDDQQWHVYQIIRDTTYIDMIVDQDTVLHVTQNLPQHDMAFHIWVDNLIYEHVDPDVINIYKRGWIGKNEIVLDYVQIVTPTGHLDKSESPSGICLLRQVPNEIYSQPVSGLWKDYSFNSPKCNLIALTTARVEQYLRDDTTVISDDDDIRYMIDNTDYGWNTSTSFNGDASGTRNRTMLLQQEVDSASHSIKIYGETSPLLYDVTVLGATHGGIVFDQEYDETKSEGTDSLWKDISFDTKGGRIAVYVSASANEDPTPTNYGYQYTDFNDDDDDEMRIVVDTTDYGYKNDQAFYGNRQFGEPKSVLIQDSLSQGSHSIKLYTHHTPTLMRVVIYGENDEVQSGTAPFPSMVRDFDLNQNFPNPFNGITRINFSVSWADEIEIVIYNLLGKRVKTLMKRNYNPGNYTLYWNGKDEFGHYVNSGFYIYRLKSGQGQKLSRRMLYIK